MTDTLTAKEQLTDIMIRFGQRVKAARLMRAMSLEELASMIGQTKGNLSDIENGARSLTVRLMLEIAEKLQIDVQMNFKL